MIRSTLVGELSSVCSHHRYGQLSGMVEPLAGIFGAVAVVIAEPILPYALAFAAGAMIYVVVDDIIPEARTRSASCPLFITSFVAVSNCHFSVNG